MEERIPGEAPGEVLATSKAEGATETPRPGASGRDAGHTTAEGMSNRLTPVELLLRAMAVSSRSPFSCFLDEQPSQLIPHRARQALQARPDDTSLVVNPTFRYERDGNPPPELQGRGLCLQSFLPGYPLAWIQHPGTHLWIPFWARGEYSEWLGSFRAGEPAPRKLHPPVLEVLQLANILIPSNYQEMEERRWRTVCQESGAQFQSEGHVMVQDIIHPFYLGTMRKYYREVLTEGMLPLGDRLVERRYVLHSELLGMFLHQQLADLVSQIAGEPMKPSYVYFSSYQPGAVLPRHLDREQCEISVSLLVDHVPEPKPTCGWPLLLAREGPAGSGEASVVAAADLGIGDVVVFRGRELVHYREALPEGHVSSLLLFHYVPSDFSGRLL